MSKILVIFIYFRIDTTMQRLVVILLVSVLINLGLVLCARPSPPPDMHFWVMDNTQRNIFYLFDASNTNTQNISTSCTLNGQNGYDAAVASDGNIWFSTGPARLQAYDPVSIIRGSINLTTGNCGKLVDLTSSVAYAHHISAGLGGKYLYYIGDGNIWRMNLVNYATSLFLSAPSADVFFFGFGFQNGKMYSSLQYVNRTEAQPQILSSYDYDVSNDEPIIPAATTSIWDPSPVEYRNAFYKFKKCPRESSYFCGQTDYAPGQWVWSSLPNGTNSWIILDTFVPTSYANRFYEYYTSPWGYMYATTNLPGFYSFDYTAANPPLSIYPFMIENTTAYGSFVALIQDPDVSISSNDGVCFADVYFYSYYWVTKYVIEVKNSATGLFEDNYSVNDTVVNDAEIRYVSLPVMCDSPTKSFRIRYEGDTNLSDNVYTLYTTASCSCYMPPIAPVVDANVVPILECIEKVNNTNFVVHLGYENLEDSAVYIPAGDNNKFSDTTDRSQPTLFRQGRTSFYPTSEFSFATNSASISWFLSYYQLPITTQDTTVYCPSTLRVQLRFFYSIINPDDQAIEAVRVAMAQYLKISETRVKVVNYQVTPTTTKRAGLAGGNNVTLEAEIGAANPNTQEPSASDSVTNLVQASRNTTASEQIIDPSSQDPDSKIISVKPLATGVEQSGIAQPVGKPGSPTPVGTTSSVTRSTIMSIAPSLIALVAILMFE